MTTQYLEEDLCGQRIDLQDIESTDFVRCSFDEFSVIVTHQYGYQLLGCNGTPTIQET